MPKQFLFLYLLISFQCIGQSSDYLEKLNGFKNFKFNSSLSSYKKKTQNTDNPFVKTIAFNKKELNLKISHIEVCSLELYFFKRKLFQIKVQFSSVLLDTGYLKVDNYTDEEYAVINYYLKSVFGDGYKCSPVNPENIGCEIWDSKNIRLEHTRNNFGKVNEGTRYETSVIAGSLLFTYKPLDTLQKKSELEE